MLEGRGWKRWFIGAVMLIGAVPAAARAQGSGRNGPPQPPPEAFAACAPLSEGAACTVHVRSEDIQGTCRRGPDGRGALACAPNRGGPHMPPPHMMPPREAVDACAARAAGDACQFTMGEHSVDGTCKAGPDASAPLACAPARPGPMPPPPPPPPTEAINACAGRAEGAACSFTHEGRELSGVCHGGPEREMPLACAPADSRLRLP